MYPPHVASNPPSAVSSSRKRPTAPSIMSSRSGQSALSASSKYSSSSSSSGSVDPGKQLAILMHENNNISQQREPPQMVDITGTVEDVTQQQQQQAVFQQQLLGNLLAMVAQQQHQQQPYTMSPQMLIALIEAGNGLRGGGGASPFVGTLPGVPPPHPPPYNQSATPPMLQKFSADKCSAASTNCTRDGQMPHGPMSNNNHNNTTTNANQHILRPPLPPATTAFGNNVSGPNTTGQLLTSFGFPMYGSYDLLPRLLTALQQSPPAAISPQGLFGCHFVPQLHPNNANGTKQSPQLNQKSNDVPPTSVGINRQTNSNITDGSSNNFGNTGAIGKGSSRLEKGSKSSKKVTFACEVDELDIAKRTSSEMLMQSFRGRPVAVSLSFPECLCSAALSILEQCLEDLQNATSISYPKQLTTPSLRAVIEQLDCALSPSIDNNLNTESPSLSLEQFKSILMFSHRLSAVLVNCASAAYTVSIQHFKGVSEQCRHVHAQAVQFYKDFHSDARRTLLSSDADTLKTELGRLEALMSALPSSEAGSRGGIDVQPVGLDEEMRRMGEAIATAMAHIGDLQKRSRETNSGIRLEVNDNILDACLGLMNAVRVLVIRSTEVQEEIVAQGKQASSPSEFYKRNHLWTEEGLISAGRAVGVAATELMKSADSFIMGKGGAFEHLIVAADSVAASVAQLFVSSRVKAAEKGSEKLLALCKASKAVNLCTAGLVKTVKSGQQLLAEEHVPDFSNLSLHETKEAKMKSQVRVLELESELTNERLRFAELRKQHFRLASLVSNEKQNNENGQRESDGLITFFQKNKKSLKMINRFIRNFLNGHHIICKVQQIQTVRVAFLHQCTKNVCPAAVISCGARMASSSSNRPSHHSKLLDAYHNRRTANLQLADLGEHVVAFALDSQGSRFIQQKLGRANPTEKAQLVDALRGHVLTLSKNLYGSHVIQAALKSIINELLAQVIPLSLHKYGSWVIRFVLEHCTHKRLMLEQLHANVPTLVTDQYGSYVIEHVLAHGLPEDRARIVRSLHNNVPSLVTDQYGCYVIEHVIEHGLPEDRERIVRSLQGDIMKYAQDKFGYLVMLKCFACGTADQKKALFDNVCGGGPKTLQNARQLMADEFGSHVIQKFFECGTDDQKAQLVDALRGHVLELALQMYGCHVIQAALKSVDNATQIEILEELTPRSCVIKCIKDQYGCYVIDTIIELIEPQRLQFVVDAILSSPSDSVASLSLHEYGNWVIRHVLEHCTEQQKRPVLKQLLDNVPTLVMDQYGNHVIRHVLEHGLPEDRARIVRSLRENVTSLSLHEYGSWVIRHVLEHCTEQQKRPVLEQLHANVPSLVADQYGNFVIQLVIEHGRPEDRERIVRNLQGDILKTHRKSICNIIEKCLIFGTTEQKNALIDQVCADDGTGKPPLLQMMKQQFANDVVLKMVDGADSAHRDKMMFAIEEHIPALLKRQQSLAKRGGAVADKRKKPNNG
ncbi:ILWEQ [Globodera pallida]|nr:ILWEQ [Globodera pallida]